MGHQTDWKGTDMSRWGRLLGFAGILFLGLLAASARADGTSSPLLVFSQSGNEYPRYSTWNGIAWSSTSNTRNTGGEATWVVAKNCPTRDEFACACLDWGADVNLIFRIGGTWSGPTELTNNAGGSAYKALDLAYESQSGDLLVAHWEGGSTDKICYRVWNGSVLSGESQLTMPSTSTVRWVGLYPDPKSDKIVMLTLNVADEIYAVAWDGGGWGAISTLESGTGLDSRQCFDMAYESQSGDGLVVYAEAGANNPRYRTWDGAVWSNEGQLPSVGSAQRWFRLAADPASDQILLGALDNACDINVNVWDGGAWGTNQEIEAEDWTNSVRSFDIAYEAGGTEALIVYNDSDLARFRYRRWDGSSWASEVVGPDLGDLLVTPQLVTGINTGEIFMAAQNNVNNLKTLQWNGSSFSSVNEIEPVVPKWGSACYMIAMPAAAATLFTDVTTAAGLGSVDCDYGVAWADYNNDGYPDVYVSGENKLYKNDGDGTFSAGPSITSDTTYRRAAHWGDYDNDGNVDLATTFNMYLNRNNGDNTFTRLSNSSIGITSINNLGDYAWLDYNGDGILDIWAPNGNSPYCYMYRGSNGGTFTAIDADNLGITANTNGETTIVADYDNDGYTDILYRAGSVYVWHADGDGTFTVGGNSLGISLSGGVDYGYNGTAFGDYDNDGDLDLYGGQDGANKLFRNNGNGTFSDVTSIAKVAGTSNDTKGVAWGDYDNDGDLDLYVAHDDGTNHLYENNSNGTFTDMAATHGVADVSSSNGVAWEDYDNDGDLDLFVGNNNASLLFRNNTDNTNYLKVRVVGGGVCGTNKAGIGVRVDLYDAAGTTFLATRTIGTSTGYGCSKSMWAHFGGVTNTQTYTIKVRLNGGWSSQTVVPARATTTIGSTVISQMLTIEEEASQVAFTDVSSATRFNVQSSNDFECASGLHWGDLDNDGDLDAILTGNISSRLMIYDSAGGAFGVSSFGGGSIYRQGALLDVDNDGDLDFWGMPHYANEKLFLNNGSASFTDAGASGFSIPYNNEGIASSDVNGDGWCDVLNFSENGNWIGHNQGAETPAFVGTTATSYGLNDSGDFGNGDYCSSGDVNNDGMLDFFYHYNGGKLFLSDGDGTYTQTNYGISVTTGGSDKLGSAWGDYDNDGDLDLFACRYDTGQTGYLWRNDVNWTAGSGSFTNVTAAAGIVDTSGQRSCCWGDYDNDGDLDLYIATRDGADNILYRNQGDGTFVEACAGASVPGNAHDAVFVDYNNDGDLDLAVIQEDEGNTLLENNLDDVNYLKVRVVGLGAGGTNVAAIGIRVELWNSTGTTFIARREIGVARGFAGSEPLWAHFGGVTNTATYTVKVYFTGRAVDDPYSQAVVPASATTTIGGTTIPQMVTIQEPQGVKIIQWREVPNRPTG